MTNQDNKNLNVIIREIKEKDVIAVQKLIYQLKNYNLEIEEARHIIKNYQTEHYKAFVAEVDDNVIGLVAISITHSFVRIVKYCRIMALIVDKNHRNMQTGKKLMTHAEDYAKENNCIWIDLTSNKKREKDGALRFYESIGFKNVGLLETNYLKKDLC